MDARLFYRVEGFEPIVVQLSGGQLLFLFTRTRAFFLTLGWQFDKIISVSTIYKGFGDRDMGGFFEILLYPIGIVIFMLPVVLALFLATAVDNFFSGVCRPITEPIHTALQTVSGRVPNPLDRIPSFPKIKRYFGSTKNILFVAFVIVFLLVHYLSMNNMDVTVTGIPLLFPGSAFDVFLSYAMAQGKLDLSSFFVNPENYLQTIIFSGITGLFLHLGCTTREEGTKIHFLVKLIYILLITLFSSVVLGKIPSDMFTITLPEFSSRLEPVSIGIDNANAEMLLATLLQWGGILLKKMATLIPIALAIYFLCQSISGFAAAFLGGFLAIAVLSRVFPQAFLNPDSLGSAIALLVAVSLAEAVALLFGEYINKIASRLLEKIEKVFDYYNIVSLLISYFSYPLLVMPVMTLTPFISNGYDTLSWLICMACLGVFSLVTFAGYKINQWAWKRETAVDGKKYALLMVINIPILLIYAIMFRV